MTAVVYVALSRVNRLADLADLAILRPFDYKVLLIEPRKSQVAEMGRIDELYIQRLSFVCLSGFNVFSRLCKKLYSAM